MSILDSVGEAIGDAATAVADFFSEAWHAITDIFSSQPVAAPVQSCPLQALTPDQAQAWFDHFKNEPGIPWNYPNDCCYNRAYVMAKELEAAGVPVGKVWNYAPDPTNGEMLRVNTPNDPKGYVEWGYHVAPTIPVRDANGVVSDMVIDPSIADRPLTPSEWKALQEQPGSTLVETSADPFYRAPDGRSSPPPSDQKVQEIFDSHRAARAANWAGKGGP